MLPDHGHVELAGLHRNHGDDGRQSESDAAGDATVNDAGGDSASEAAASPDGEAGVADASNDSLPE
jgi:hypothetical protein